jgi:H+/gluconate symporter-like permease
MGMLISTMVGIPLIFAAGVMFAIIASKLKDAAKSKSDTENQGEIQKARKYAIWSATTCMIAAILLFMIAIFAF